MIYTQKIKDAIKFATKTHEVYQKQKRKGKDIPYITHPLTVGLILSRAGADEDTVVAGILHDTMEDSVPEKKVSREILAQRFGEKVADIVNSVTEQNKELPWQERKDAALAHIATFSHDSLLVKSADIIGNASELVEDCKRDGDAIFSKFNAPKEKILQHYLRTITAIIERWSDNQLVDDLRSMAQALQSIGEIEFMIKYPAIIIEYADYSKDMTLQCPVCGWRGTPKGNVEWYQDLLDVTCPNCDRMLLVVGYPLIKKGV